MHMMTNDAAMTAEEKRALSADEQALSDAARQPALGRASDSDLADLIRRLRDRRDRARDIGDRQRREARGKSAPAGATPAGGDEGTRSKQDYLSDALGRAMEERERRAAPSQADLAQRAADLKAQAARPDRMTEDGGALHPNDPDADPGKAGLADTGRRTNQSGAFEHVGEVPSRERSRTRY